MQLLKQWRGEGSRKRAAEDSSSSQGSLRKRIKDDDHGRRNESGDGDGDGIERDQEYRIRGMSTINQDLFHSSSSSLSPFPNQSASSSLATESMRSSPPIHPDRRDNINNTASTSTFTPTSSSAPIPAPTPAPTSNPASTSLIKTQSPRSPLSQAAEHINKVILEDERRM